MKDAQTLQRVRAIEMRTVGMPWQKVADECGYGSAMEAAKDIYTVLADRQKEIGDQVAGLRAIEVEKLDAMERVIISIMRKPHVLAQQGRVVIDPTTGKPAEDPGPMYQAVDRLLRIHERRSKLLGLDAPVKAQVEVKQVGVDAEIAGLLAGMVSGGEVPAAGYPEVRPVAEISPPEPDPAE